MIKKNINFNAWWCVFFRIHKSVFTATSKSIEKYNKHDIAFWGNFWSYHILIISYFCVPLYLSIENFVCLEVPPNRWQSVNPFLKNFPIFQIQSWDISWKPVLERVVRKRASSIRPSTSSRRSPRCSTTDSSGTQSIPFFFYKIRKLVVKLMWSNCSKL